MIFLRLIDHFTPRHISLLAFLHNPTKWMEEYGIQKPNITSGSVSNILEHCFIELKDKNIFYEQFIRNLQSEGMIHEGSLNTMMTANGLYDSRTTVMGKNFLDFITPPK